VDKFDYLEKMAKKIFKKHPSAVFRFGVLIFRRNCAWLKFLRKCEFDGCLHRDAASEILYLA